MLYSTKWAYAPIGPEGDRELFDLESDPYTERNIIADFPGIAADLHDELVGWLSRVEAPPDAIEVFR